MVYLQRSGTEIPLGRVPGLATQQLSIPEVVLGAGSDLRLTAGTRGRPATYGSLPFDWLPGRTIEWTIDYRLPSNAVIMR